MYNIKLVGIGRVVFTNLGVQVNTPSLYKTTVLSIMKDSYSTNLVTNQLQVVRKALNW